MTPEGLVAGPRGRRLLLAFAVASERAVRGEGVERPLGTAAFDVSFRLAKDHGHAITRFGWGATATRSQYTVGDVVSQLALVPLVTATSELLVEALSASVDSAMYWQEPDGDDLLCAVPEVCAALARIAEHLVDSPVVQAWAAPLDPADQWQIAWQDCETTPRTDLGRWREKVLAEELKARRERPTSPRANWSGEWWSHPPHGLSTSTRAFGDAGPYGLWLVEDALGWEAATAWRLEIDPSARIYEIDCAGAWAALCLEFPLVVTASRRHDWYRTTGRAGPWVIPDWSLVADHYDGVHLTIAGYLAAATTAIEAGDAASVIAGWGPDATWWFNDTARPVGEPVGWRARRDGGQLPWAPTR